MISSKVLDKKFKDILNEFDVYCEKKDTNINTVLCNAGLYSKRVMGYESMHQGKFIEDILVGLTGAKPLDTDGKEVESHLGNCDIEYNGFQISVKSSIRTDKTFLSEKRGNGVGANTKAKIYDASRKSFECDKQLLSSLLFNSGYELPILSYIYELKSNRGMIFMTSLHEVASFKNNIDLSNPNPKMIAELYEAIEELFQYNNASHFLLPLKDLQETAHSYNRVLEFSISEEEANQYVENKLNEVVSSIDLIL
jgi:hypothetical protein